MSKDSLTSRRSEPSPGRKKTVPNRSRFLAFPFKLIDHCQADLGTGEPKIVRRRGCFDGRPAVEGHDETMLVLYSRVPALA